VKTIAKMEQLPGLRCGRSVCRVLAGIALAAGAFGPAAHAKEDAVPPGGFERASIGFEQNATDGDVEVVFKITGGDEGLAGLTVVSPDGRTVADFKAPDASTMGIREFELESPEPRDVKGLKAAYPEGVYRFTGVTVGGHKLSSQAKLSHELPATVSLLEPKPGASKVSVKGLAIRWTPVPGVSGYIIELENDDLHVALKVNLPASAKMFAVPDGFLQPGTEYDLGIATVSKGNVSFIETSFTTAE
jgi:hypothetical protein